MAVNASAIAKSEYTMLGFAWFTLRKANAALKQGRLDDVCALLNHPHLRNHRRTGELRTRLSTTLVSRGRERMQQGNLSHAWLDLLQAEEVQSNNEVEQFREELTRCDLTRLRKYLDQGEPGRSLEIAEELRTRAVSSNDLSILEEAARSWQTARSWEDRGDFGQAIREGGRGNSLLNPPCSALEQYCRSLEQRQTTLQPLLNQLHEANERAGWQEVVAIAEKVLKIAPQNEVAKTLRSRAWREIEPVTVIHVPTTHTLVTTAVPREKAENYQLLIDGVGAFLICPGRRISLGRATVDGQLDVPLLADVSRLHAYLNRDDEGCVIEAAKPVKVNTQMVDRTALRNGDRVTLGTSFQFLYRQPVPLSTSARLEIVSGHRLASLSIDAILVMGDTLVLGSGSQVHVAMPGLKKPIVLFRGKNGLGVRLDGCFRVNGVERSQRSELPRPATVTGQDFSFTVE